MYRCFISFLVKNTIFRIGYLNEKRIARNQKKPHHWGFFVGERSEISNLLKEDLESVAAV